MFRMNVKRISRNPRAVPSRPRSPPRSESKSERAVRRVGQMSKTCSTISFMGARHAHTESRRRCLLAVGRGFVGRLSSSHRAHATRRERGPLQLGERAVAWSAQERRGFAQADGRPAADIRRSRIVRDSIESRRRRRGRRARGGDLPHELRGRRVRPGAATLDWRNGSWLWCRCGRRRGRRPNGLCTGGPQSVGRLLPVHDAGPRTIHPQIESARRGQSSRDLVAADDCA